MTCLLFSIIYSLIQKICSYYKTYIIIGVFLGIKIMILGMIVNSLIAYFLNSYWSGKSIGYSSMQQLGDILPSFLIGLFAGIAVFGIGYLVDLPHIQKLILQVCTGFVLVFGISELFHLESYLYIKQIILQHLRNNQHA